MARWRGLETVPAPRRGPRTAKVRRRPDPAVGPRTPRLPRFHALVYRVVRRIPRGKVATYGQVAAILGQPRGARAVGMALGALQGRDLDGVPWQRVVNAAGRCSHRDGFWAGYQQELLQEEGVVFDRRGHLDFDRFRWRGPRKEWKTRLRGEL